MVGAVQGARRVAWMALVEHDGQRQLLCARAHPTDRGRRIVSGRLRALLHAVAAVDAASATADAHTTPSRTALRSAVQRALRDIRRWHVRHVVRRDAGPTDRAMAPLARRAAGHLAQIVQRCAPLERVALRAAISDAERVVQRARGTGAEDALARWCAQAAGTPAVRAWITAWQQEPVLARLADHAPVSTAPQAETSACRVHALLLIGHDVMPDYTSACHDTRSCSTSTAP